MYLFKKVSILMCAVFFLNIFLVPAVQAKQADKLTNNDMRLINFARGKVSSLLDITKTLGKKPFMQMLKSNFTENIEKIEEKIFKEIEKEGLENVINDFDKLGPIGQNFAKRLKKYKDKNKQLESIKNSVHVNLKAMVAKIDEMDNKQITKELEGSLQRFSYIEKKEMIQSAGLDRKLDPSVLGAPIIEAKKDAELDNYLAEGFSKLFKGLKVVGIAGVIMVVVAGGIMLSGHAAIGTGLLVLGAAAVSIPVVLLIKFVKALANSF
jgi:hypothetical protein